MSEFWEEAFKSKNQMWGWDPANAALIASGIFHEAGYKKILIPGIGYGRNAQPFVKEGMEVTGIEISETAIAIAKTRYGDSLKLYHGSVTEMPFDENRYDGIFAHALIHLLNEDERAKLIADCYEQLHEGGMMIFTAITKEAVTYGQGKPVGPDRFEQFGGVRMFFYDGVSIQQEFGGYGLASVEEVMENYPFHLIRCVKQN
ncbi:hypothetical protein DYBT9275_05431 [Dyadobacter sp. CECT 9275]|uniref:Methyltransferase type 11 domain-containing protein n=1 Tax=Dyadobacter helix TaxID=2822344 RepID=A0A916N7B0_9BACT|nr:class I SAM-dependent methyltransferase [Dyadobacter sp. CECT 9275]CAG5015866.1 hypothetical protein DYBT9275_05431 [Dyadobacter sp. CECT 9275]